MLGAVFGSAISAPARGTPDQALRSPPSALSCPCVGSNWRPLATRNGVSLMKILALEFSSSQRSVAVVQPGRAEEVIEAGSQGPNALGMIAEALRASGLEREQIECLAIGLGPGSYTGIRAAIALAQGWQLALGTRLLGISTVECLATQPREEAYAGKVAIAIDAQRSEFYLASYDLGARDAPGTGPYRGGQTEKGQPISVARAT